MSYHTLDGYIQLQVHTGEMDMVEPKILSSSEAVGIDEEELIKQALAAGNTIPDDDDIF
ncbi:MAG: hypothetical protein GY847_09675 [Proteobacteria bacterium]|nr:hypothetical protein [Pseudomonadota bacterium]